jgi:hypothetical protein
MQLEAVSVPTRRISHSLRAAVVLALVLATAKLAVYAVLAMPAGGLTKALCQWDCDWYLSVAGRGYDRAPLGDLDQANWAFFPLYPLLIRAAHVLFGDGVAPALGVSFLCLLGFAALSILYLRETRSAPNDRLWIAFLLSLPFSFYYYAPYSESLYLFLGTACLLFLHRGSALKSACLLGVFTAVRPTAMLLLPVLFADRLRYVLRDIRPGATKPDYVVIASNTILPLALAPLGLFAFMAFLWLRVGDPLAFLHAQVAWHRSAQNPFPQILDGLRAFDWWHIAAGGRRSNSFGACFALFGFALSGYMAWHRRFTEAWFSAATLLMALSTGLYSLPRFIMGNPAYLFAMFDLLAAIRRPYMRGLLVAACAALQVILLFQWFDRAEFLM